VNTLDLVVLVLILGAGVGGWRLGFVARVIAWAGVVVGLAIGIRFVPRVVTAFGGAKPQNRASVAVLFLVMVAMLGQTLGLVLGGLVHRVMPLRKRLPRWDRMAGATVGAIGVLALLWMVIPSLATAKGWPARLARGSTIVAAIERWAPRQPARFAAWGRAISDAPYPSALGPLQTPPNPGPPPGTSITAAVDTRVRASTVLVTGRACNTIQEGSGWIAAPGLVVTNAHVVAGEAATTVQDESGSAMPATVIAFDPVRDVAVLDVPALTGHPGGGALQASPARVGAEILAVGTDIYRTGTSRRHVYVLAAALAPGDSGGALVNRSGEIIGMAFAIDPGRNATAYALTDAEIRPVIRQVLERDPTPVATGRCLVG
jgi:uncharacterized membrane protein required for colicin V production